MKKLERTIEPKAWTLETLCTGKTWNKIYEESCGASLEIDAKDVRIEGIYAECISIKGREIIRTKELTGYEYVFKCDCGCVSSVDKMLFPRQIARYIENKYLKTLPEVINTDDTETRKTLKDINDNGTEITHT